MFMKITVVPSLLRLPTPQDRIKEPIQHASPELRMENEVKENVYKFIIETPNDNKKEQKAKTNHEAIDEPADHRCDEGVRVERTEEKVIEERQNPEDGADVDADDECLEVEFQETSSVLMMVIIVIAIVLLIHDETELFVSLGSVL
ncbi:hypothetical protein BELL_0402g00140 [Botrytis elliptica]|uniref:Uncharacterized protein n=1 Tax=Botrytis elliptica TaxID=278938 RepID=A0A4Z1JP28_9HELO|nr:hypothetical protein BELL_0402g00140 [Botrytis elliptica]